MIRRKKKSKKGQEGIGHDPRGGNQDQTFARVIQVVEVHRDGFGPAEAKKEEHQCPDRVEVLERIQAEPPKPLGRGVPHLTRHPPMGELMEDNRIEKGNDQEDKSGGIGQKKPEKTHPSDLIIFL